MANPYHDEAGRFASRDEMRGAIDRLRNAGDLKGALALSLELSDIDYARAKEAEKVDSSAFYGGTSPESLQRVSEPELRQLWNVHHDELYPVSEFLKADNLSPVLLDQIVSSLNFGDRYDLLEENQFTPAVGRALLEGQEDERLGNLTYDHLVWAAIPSLDRRSAAKQAVKSPSLAQNFLVTHGYLKGSAQFDRQLIQWGHKSGQAGTWTQVATESEDREVLTSLANERGITLGNLEALAASEHLGNQGAAAVLDRAGSFLGDWDTIRRNLAANPSVAQDLRNELSNRELSIRVSEEPYAPDAAELKRYEQSAEQAEANFDALRERIAELSRQPLSEQNTADYYEAAEAQRDAFGAQKFHQAVRDAAPQYFDRMKRQEPQQDGDLQARLRLEQRIERAQAFLQWRLAKQSFDRLLSR